MSDNLETKAKVALDLLAQGAEEVTITGTDIKVSRKSREDKTQQSQSGNTVINVNTNATASSSVNISAQFSIVKEELRRIHESSPMWPQLVEKIDQLEKEVKKSKPDKSSLKDKLRWLLDFGWDVFAKVAPIILSSM
jgi:hypothetical protein